MSVCAALGYRWDGRRSRLFFQTREGSYNMESLIRFLSDLHRDLGGQNTVLIWDGLPACKSRAMKEYLERERNWLRVENCRATHRTSIRWRRCGEISKGRNWLIVVVLFQGSSRMVPRRFLPYALLWRQQFPNPRLSDQNPARE